MKQGLLFSAVLAAAIAGGWFLRGFVTKPARPPSQVKRASRTRPATPPPAEQAGSLQTAEPAPGAATADANIPAAPPDAPSDSVSREAEIQRIREEHKAARKAVIENMRNARQKKKELAEIRREANRMRREEFMKDFPDPNRPTGPLIMPPKINPRVLDEQGQVIEEAPRPGEKTGGTQ